MPEPLSKESKPAIPLGQEGTELTVRLPGKPKREIVTDRVESREDSDATIRLSNLPPSVHRAGAGRAEAQKELNAENPPPEAPT